MFSRFLSSRFRYLSPGPLVDGELELVVPHVKWVDALLAAYQDPLTVQMDPSQAATTRQRVMAFLEMFPAGRQPLKNRPADVPPAYFFWMRIHSPDADRIIAGGISLRIGHTTDLEQYMGHIGCHVYPPWRGRHYAARAARLLFPLARRHGINPVWITCNPDNFPSRRTCERVGGKLIDIVDLPDDHPLRGAGDRRKCRYKVDL